MKRGFLLSLDALFALSLVLLALSFFAMRPSFEAQAGEALFLGGRDYLASGGAIEADLLRRGWAVDVLRPVDSAVSVRAERFVYPRVCGLSTLPGSACLNQSDAALAPPRFGVWVGAG